LAQFDELPSDSLEERREKREMREIEILMENLKKSRNRAEKRRILAAYNKKNLIIFGDLKYNFKKPAAKLITAEQTDLKPVYNRATDSFITESEY
jgi:metallophosphoesterase superfamily enzyme